jgi:hypothetical protein
VQPAQRLELYYEMTIAIILIPAVMMVALIIWMKKAPKYPEGKSSAI